MTRTVVCFGDSNTHGADPSGAGRLPRDVRWPRVMERALGDGYEIIEEGLNGRCTVWDTPTDKGRNGLTYLYPCLISHAPVDLVIIMLAPTTSSASTASPQLRSPVGRRGWWMRPRAR